MASLVRSSPHTRNVQIEDHICTVEFAGDDGDVAALLQHLLHAGAKILTFADKDPSLEDVFMMVTKGLVT